MDTLYAFRSNLVVAASAGTGKTHALVGVVVHLVLGASELGGAGPREPIDPARIVATTFSRKAAAEIRARVVETLERLASGDERAPYRADLAAARTGAGLEAWSARAIAERARRALDRIGRAQIGTLHGFASTIARRYALELGLSPSLTLEEEDETRARVVGAIERTIGERFEAHDETLRALVRACGGVDRLVDQIARVLGRLEEDGRGARQLDIANDDAATVERRVAHLVELARPLVGEAKLGPAARAVVASFESGDAASQRDALVDLLVHQRRGKISDAASALFDARDDLPGSTHIARARTLMRLFQSRAALGVQLEGARALLVACEDAITSDARRASSLGFSDVLRAGRDVLRDHPAAAAELGAELDVLLVDEFQDTSRLQRDLVQLVWERDPSARAPGTSAVLADVRPNGLFIVGDRKQSIYAFRGADVGVFAALCVGLAGAPARVALGIPQGATWEPETPLADFVSLRHNRRSATEILDFANAFSARRLQPKVAPPELYEIAYAPDVEDLLPPPERTPDVTRVPRTTWLRVAITGERRDSSRRIDEAYAIAERVQRLVAEDGGATRWRDCAVLAESNAMLDTVAFALAQAGVPYVVAGSGFHAAREVRDLLALLAVVVRTGDALSLLAVLRGPWAGVHDDTLLALTDPHHGLAEPSAWDQGERRARVRPEDRASLARVRDVVERLRVHADSLGAGAILREAVRALELEEVLVQLPRGTQRVANVRKLLDLADRSTTSRAFLDAMHAAADREARETEGATFSDDDDAVRLLTVHASKGLAFPIVFVPQVGESARSGERGALVIEARGEDPARLALKASPDGDDEPIEPPSYERAVAVERRRERAERARLAYVAVTRAERALYLVGDRRVPRSGASETYAATNAATLAALADDDGARESAALDVEPVTPQAPRRAPSLDAVRAPPVPPASLVAAWRVLPIATTALQDFDHCARRFQLAHLLDLPEKDLPRFAVAAADEERPAETLTLRLAGPRDPRAEGTLAHRLLEHVDADAFGRTDAAQALDVVLDRERVARADPLRASVGERVARFMGGTYAARVRRDRAELSRERPFVVRVDAGDGREIAVRGAIDLLVAWPDGRVDVLDYKRARGPSPAPYALQLAVYSLAVREMFPSATAIRAGILFLGGDPSEPTWLTLDPPEALRARVASLALALAEARGSTRFARVAVDRCRALGCGYVSLCHPDTESINPSSNIDAKPSRPTTT